MSSDDDLSSEDEDEDEDGDGGSVWKKVDSPMTVDGPPVTRPPDTTVSTQYTVL